MCCLKLYGSSTGHMFLSWLKVFVKHIRAAKENSLLIFLDEYKSQKFGSK